MTLSGPRKHCPTCSKPMQHWGRHPSGSRRWRCQDCGKNAVRKRKDNREKTRLSLFVHWLKSKDTLTEVSRNIGVSRQTLNEWFRPFWGKPPEPQIKGRVRVLVIDGTSVVPRQLTLLIAGNSDNHQPVSWVSVFHECYDQWLLFLSDLSWKGLTPKYVVGDGQRGLIKAIHAVWPRAKIQRCLIHVVRQAKIWLTQKPQTKAGRELLALVKQLSQIQSKRQKRRWIRSFRSWRKRNRTFLKERSYGPGGNWWYTHRRLRGTSSLIKNSLLDLFRYVTDPTVPKTSNHVEGGLNARIQELFRCHRGLSPKRKLVLAAWYLALRQGQKPTRKFT